GHSRGGQRQADGSLSGLTATFRGCKEASGTGRYHPPRLAKHHGVLPHVGNQPGEGGKASTHCAHIYLETGVSAPNHPLQPTAAAILVSRSSWSLSAAAAAELVRSPPQTSL